MRTYDKLNCEELVLDGGDPKALLKLTEYSETLYGCPDGACPKAGNQEAMCAFRFRTRGGFQEVWRNLCNVEIDETNNRA